MSDFNWLRGVRRTNRLFESLGAQLTSWPGRKWKSEDPSSASVLPVDTQFDPKYTQISPREFVEGNSSV